MALETYRAKRDFAEPGAGRQRPPRHRRRLRRAEARGPAAALRLAPGDRRRAGELGGTRGPSLVPGEKRLAVHVEDHPLDYADFEGTIAKGQYGGGEVIVWDRGRWQPEGDPRKG